MLIFKQYSTGQDSGINAFDLGFSISLKTSHVTVFQTREKKEVSTTGFDALVGPYIDHYIFNYTDQL
jgi:hypothetical protein